MKRADPLARSGGMFWLWQMEIVLGSSLVRGWTMRLDSPDSSAEVSR